MRFCAYLNGGKRTIAVELDGSSFVNGGNLAEREVDGLAVTAMEDLI